MKLSILAGSTSQTINVFIRDSSSTTGAGLTGLVFNSASLTAYYALPKAAAVQITLATLAAVTSAYSSGGFKEIDATNMPGWYRLDLPDAAIASGRFVSLHLKGATNMASLPVEIELTAWNNQDGVRGGMTALPNAAAEASGGLITRGTSTGQLSVSGGVAQADLQTIKTQTVTCSAGVTVGAYVGNATAALSVDASGRIDLGKILGTASQGAVGYVGVDWGAVANKTTTNSLTGTTIATSQVVASVSGAVGSVGTDGITAASMAADAVAEIQSGLSTLTAAGVRTAVGLASANLDTQLDALPTNAELATALGTADDAVLSAIAALNNLSSAQLASAIAAGDDATLAAIAALNNLSAAQVNAEVVDALATDTYAEPGQGTPAATATLAAKLNYLFKAWRNRSAQTATEYALYGDDAVTKDQKATCSDDNTTFERGEVATGA